MTVLDAAHQNITAFSARVSPMSSGVWAGSRYSTSSLRSRLRQRMRRSSAVAPRIEIEGLVPVEVRKVQFALNDALAMSQNWDSYGGRTPTMNAAVKAISWLLAVYRHGLPAPSTVPGSDGSIQLEWHTRGIDLEVLFAPNRRTSFVFADLKATMQDEEGELNSQNADGRAFLDLLVSRPKGRATRS